MRDSSEIVIGIDLGTTHSLVAWCGEAGPQVLRDASGDARVPSVLQFDDQGGVTIGWKARLHAVEHPESTVYSIKRLMGRGYEELLAAGELTHLAYAVVKRATDVPGRDIAAALVNGRLLTPPEISAMILRELKDRAAAHLGCDVTKAVITVPAYFDDAQRQATRDAGRIAGLEVLRIVNEPTAAALAYGLGVRTQLEAREGRDEGATEGGALLARRLRSPSAADEVNTPKPGQPRGSPGSRQLPLAGSCSPAGPQPGSLDASTHRGPTDSEQESLVAIYDLGGGTFDVSILRLCEGVFEVLSTHGNTNLGGDDLDREIMMLVYREIREQFQLDVESPATRQSVRSLAESVKIRLSTEASATVEIDLGSGSIYRRTINRAEFEGMIDPWIEKTLQSCRQALRDAGMNPAGIDQVVLVGGSTRIPLVRQRVRDLFQRQPYTALNPDEVVALGAAVQAGILSGIRGDALLLDVVPLSLGIETMGGAMGKLILRNTRIPCQATERFSTFVDGQISVKINVLQGERELARDCRSLGEFELCGLPPMPAGIPKILVTFLIDENGILHVTAREERSKKEASIQIVPTHGLTAEEVRRMELAAYEHAREDMSAHRLIDLRNQVAFDTGKAEQMLAKVGDELSPSARAEIETAMRDLRQLAGTSDDPDTIFAALSTFDRKTLRLAELAILVTLRHDDGAPPGAQHHSED